MTDEYTDNEIEHQKALNLVLDNFVTEVRKNRSSRSAVRSVLQGILNGLSYEPEPPMPPQHFQDAASWFQAKFTVTKQLEALWLSRLSTRLTEENGWEFWTRHSPQYSDSIQELDTGKRVPTLGIHRDITFYSADRKMMISFERDSFDVDVIINSYYHDDVDDLISEVENIVIDPDPFENKIVRLEQNDVRILNIDVGEIQGYEAHVEDAVRWLTSIADPQIRQKLEKASLPKRAGLLLEGPPGSGKTTLARRIAKDLEGFVTVIYPTASMSIQDIFDFARNYDPVLIVLEDVESFFGERGHNSFSSFLNELDGIENDDSLMLLATTNDSSNFDSAIRRPGRLERNAVITKIHSGAYLDMLSSRLAWESEEILNEVLEHLVYKIKDKDMTPATLDAFARSAIMLGFSGSTLVDYARNEWKPSYEGQSHLHD